MTSQRRKEVTHLGIKTQVDLTREPKRVKMVCPSDEGQEVLEGKICLVIWQEQVWIRPKFLDSVRTLVLHTPWLPTSDRGEDGVPLLGRGLLLFPQPLVGMAEAGGEQLTELLQRLGLLPRGCHDGQEHPPVGLNRIPQATAAVQALLELADHAGHPAGTADWLYAGSYAGRCHRTTGSVKKMKGVGMEGRKEGSNKR